MLQQVNVLRYDNLHSDQSFKWPMSSSSKILMWWKSLFQEMLPDWEQGALGTPFFPSSSYPSFPLKRERYHYQEKKSIICCIKLSKVMTFWESCMVLPLTISKIYLLICIANCKKAFIYRTYLPWKSIALLDMEYSKYESSFCSAELKSKVALSNSCCSIRLVQQVFPDLHIFKFIPTDAKESLGTTINTGTYTQSCGTLSKVMTYWESCMVLPPGLELQILRGTHF